MPFHLSYLPLVSQEIIRINSQVGLTVICVPRESTVSGTCLCYEYDIRSRA